MHGCSTRPSFLKQATATTTVNTNDIMLFTATLVVQLFTHQQRLPDSLSPAAPASPFQTRQHTTTTITIPSHPYRPRPAPPLPSPPRIRQAYSTNIRRQAYLECSLFFVVFLKHFRFRFMARSDASLLTWRLPQHFLSAVGRE
ncbi:hypothetical protein E2C01_005631 [Portunus trituberculatus]|uniref:Uncharacterized protein n=1 Tax=Portunus trituberculatus TaxID=210409 RepID=A0A5B7CX49_PORTR|nr:hypothetical protein [Portunus trituberculatus]